VSTAVKLVAQDASRLSAVTSSRRHASTQASTVMPHDETLAQ